MWWRTTLCLGLCGGLGVFIALGHASRQTPVFEARARLSVPYESIQDVDRAELPLDGVAGENSAQLSGSALAAWSDRVKARQLAAPTPHAFESDLDALRRPLRIDVEKQAGGDEFELIYHAADPELARHLLDAAVECCLDEYRSLRKGAAATAAASMAVQVEQLRQRVVALEATHTESRSRLAQLPITETTRPAAVEKTRLLAAAMAAARQRRLESENRLSQIRADLAEGVPVDMIISRLPDGSLRTALESSLKRQEQERDLTRLRGLVRERSRVWGKEHPKLKELQRQVADLEARASDRVVLVSSTAPAAQLALPDLLLKLLSSELQERQNNERDLGEQLSAEEATLTDYDQQVAAMTELDRTLAAAKTDENSARATFEAREKELAAVGAAVTSAATAAEEPVSRSATEWLTIGLGGGAGVGLLLSSLLGAVWSRPSRATARSLGKPAETPGGKGPRRLGLGTTTPAPTSTTNRPAKAPSTESTNRPPDHRGSSPSRAVFGNPSGPEMSATNSELSPLITPLPAPTSPSAPKSEASAVPFLQLAPQLHGHSPAPAPLAPPVALSDSAARLARLQQLQVGSAWHPAQMPPS